MSTTWPEQLHERTLEVLTLRREVTSLTAKLAEATKQSALSALHAVTVELAFEESEARATTAETALREAIVMFAVIHALGNDPTLEWNARRSSEIARDALDKIAALSAALQTEAECRNSIALNSFTEYCRSHPFERFWQALRNWSKWSFILASTTRTGAALDTFNIEGLNGTRQTEAPQAGKEK